ncbi:unnamed protein product, partial [marine sediment metagenome]
ILSHKENEFYIVEDNIHLIRKTILKDIGIIHIPTVIINKYKIKIAFIENYKYYEDQLFYLENIMKNIKIGFINSIGCRVNATEGSLFCPTSLNARVNRYKHEYKARKFFYEKYNNYLEFFDVRKLRLSMADKIKIIGNYTRASGNFEKAKIYYFKSLKTMPLIYILKKLKILYKIILVSLKKSNSILI